MKNWQQLMQHQAKQRRLYLQALADRGLSMNDGAKDLSMTPTGFAAMLKREGVNWERHAGRKDRPSKPRRTPDEYKECADIGMTVAETSRHLDVSFNAVRDMAERHGIKFKDGRRAK